MKLNVEIKVKAGDDCIAKNYRSKFGQWENGTVTHVTVEITNELKYSVHYRVRLDRVIEYPNKPWKNHHLFLTVGNDKIDACTP